MTQKPAFEPTQGNQVPPDLSTLLEALGYELKKEINCCRPGVIQSFDASLQIATVQIAQQKVTSISPTGVRTIAQFSPIVNAPVYYPSGGGYTLTFPIKAGDECIVLFNDRELDNWFEQGGVNSSPTTPRAHDLSDGFCLVGIRSKPKKLTGVSLVATQLRSDDGTTFVEVNGTGQVVTVTAPQEINLNSPVVTVQGIINVVNENSVANPCTINGKITATGDIIAGSGTTNTSLQHHVHSGVQVGGGNTGQPV